jgi:hypothetical protein
MAQQNVDQLDPERANLPTASTISVAKPEPVFFDLEKLFVNRERFRRPHHPGRGELSLGMGENFSEMTGSGHGGR